MAVIPRGEQFGQVAVQPVRMGGMGGPSTAIAQGLSDLGQGISNAVEQDQQIKQVRAGNQSLDREFQIRTVVDQLGQSLRNGTLSYENAQTAYAEAIGKLPKPSVEGLGGVALEAFNQRVRRLDEGGIASLQPAINGNRRATFKADVESGIDTIGKMVTLGVNMDYLNQRLDDYDARGQEAFGQGWNKVKREAIDRNWYNQANQRAITSRGDMAALRQMESDLSEGGIYYNNLDAEKRNIVLRSVLSDITQLENRVQMQADRREAAASRVLTQLDQQIDRGLPVTSQQWLEAQDITRGTTLEPELRSRMAMEAEVQNVLRLPVDQQASYVQRRRGELLSKGGSVRDLEGLNRLDKAVQDNVKQLQEAPLLYAQNRTGVEVEPLNFAAMAQAGGAEQIRSQMRSRMDTINAARTQYGDQVKMRPLLPQEAAGIAAMLSVGDARQSRDTLAMLRSAVGDDAAFQATMQQIAPDAPIKALAGILASKQRTLTLERNTLSPDVTATSGDVALTLLEGERALSGKQPAGAHPIPPERDFREMFSDAVGNSFADMPGRYQIAMQAVRAYYTGRAAQDGDVSGELNTDRMNQAIRAVVGSPVRAGAGAKVIAPWGMDEGDFADRAQEALRFAIRSKKIAGVPQDLDQYDLQNGNRDGEYLVRMGRNYLTDAQGNPVTINVLAPASSWGRSK